MARLPFPDPVRDLLAAPNPAVITTVRKDGQPVSVATWYLMEGDRVLVNMDEAASGSTTFGATRGSASRS